MTKKRHMHIKIDVLLAWSDEQLEGILEEEGETMSGIRARAYLEQMKDEGKEFFPIGCCPEFDYQNGCPGHNDTINI